MFTRRNVHNLLGHHLMDRFRNQIDQNLIDRRRHSSILGVNASGKEIVILTAIWWWLKLGRDGQ
jgi:hypothetical protein